MISVTFDATWWLILVFITDIAIRIAAIIIVPRNRRPTAAMAWQAAPQGSGKGWRWSGWRWKRSRPSQSASDVKP